MSGDPTWIEENQRHLVAAMAQVRERIAACADPGAPAPLQEPPEPWDPGLAPPAIELIRAAFGLSAFERSLLLACAGIELDGRMADACAAAHGDPSRGQPSFGLALAALPGAHWTALHPGGPLRRFRLIELGPAGAITAAPLRIDEAILHRLAGVRGLDARLAAVVEPVEPDGELAPSQTVAAVRVADAWGRTGAHPPAVHLGGRDAGARRAVAAAAASARSLGLLCMAAADAPAVAGERELMACLLDRQALLGGDALLIECQGLQEDEEARAAALADRLACPVVMAARESPRLARRAVVTVDVDNPTPAEQQAHWRRVLGPAAAALNGGLDAISGHFDLGWRELRAAGEELASADGAADPADALWEACRAQARPSLDRLAQRLAPATGWDDIVLPAAELATLREIVSHARGRAVVHERWGFAAAGRRGLGISALFAGQSGTGKTMAAEVLAGELRLDLYRIDLAAVVSKYIGETEKNLRRIFDAAEAGGAVLLFDEADALFGKRSEVRDSHDRYANIEVSYLLQRVEAYRGLAVLTTNARGALDPAFMRRIRFVVDFPFPGAPERAAIWSRALPPGAPTATIDPMALARIEVPGGLIRNIALRAAFLAADDGAPIGMAHLAVAARRECAKHGRPVPEAELRSWS